MGHVDASGSWCEICDKTLKSGNRKLHFQFVHMYAEKPCKVCKEIFQNPYKLNQHMKRHHQKEWAIRCREVKGRKDYAKFIRTPKIEEFEQRRQPSRVSTPSVKDIKHDHDKKIESRIEKQIKKLIEEESSCSDEESYDERVQVPLNKVKKD